MLKLFLRDKVSDPKSFGNFLSNGHSPQIRVTRSLFVQMCRGESHFFQKWPLANVSESGKSEQNRLANVGESGVSEQNRLANVGESGEYLPSLGKCWPMIRQVVLSTNNIFYMYKTIQPTLAKFARLARLAKFV